MTMEDLVAQTPISALVASIERGFLLSPSLFSPPKLPTYSAAPLVLLETTKPLNAGMKVSRREEEPRCETTNEWREEAAVAEPGSEDGRRVFTDLQVNQC